MPFRDFSRSKIDYERIRKKCNNDAVGIITSGSSALQKQLIKSKY